MAHLLDSDSLESRLSSIPKWNRKGNEIHRTFEFTTYLDGIEFVRKVADLAEAAKHHPDIDIRWRKVSLLLTTHSAGGLTDLDFDVAQQIDGLV